MTESNNEIHELTIGELDAVNGGSGLGGIMGGGGPMGMINQITQMVQTQQQQVLNSPGQQQG
jgi:hypothetical protein